MCVGIQHTEHAAQHVASRTTVYLLDIRIVLTCSGLIWNARGESRSLSKTVLCEDLKGLLKERN